MADRITTLLNDEELCAQMGHTAKQFAMQYSSEGMIKQIESLYLELLREHHNSALSSI